MAIFWRTAFVVGSMRLSVVPSLVVTIQTLSSLAVIPPSGPAGAMGRRAESRFVWTSTRASTGFLPQIGTHTLANPNARPAQASPGILTFATIRLVAGSMRWTEYGFEPATHTESLATKTQSAVAPILNVAERFNDSNGA